MATSGFTQQNQLEKVPQFHDTKKPLRIIKPNNDYHEKNLKQSQASVGSVIWQENFANGIPASWTNVILGGPGGFTYSKTGSQGQFGSPTNIINSTTKGNGFLLLDADGANSPGNPDNYIAIDAHITSGPIDLSNYQGVNLEFQHYFRLFTDAQIEVGISNDGTNFTYYDLRRKFPTNSASANPINEVFPISDLAGGKSTVYIRFKWTMGTTYYWMIDDIKIVEAPHNDLRVWEAIYGSIADSSRFKYYYTQIPERQANKDTLNFGVYFGNFGYLTQPNTRLLTTVNGPQKTETKSSPSFNFKSNRDTTINLNQPFFLNQGEGNYQLKFSLQSDSVDYTPADNEITRSITVSDSVYARDLGNPQFLSEREPGEVLTNLFKINSPEIVKSLSAYFGSTSLGSHSYGAVVRMILYGPNNFDILTTSEYQVVKRNGWNTFNIPDLNLAIGSYLVGLEVIEGSVWLGIDAGRIPPPFTTYENIDGSVGGGGDGNWYYGNFTAGIPYIRMNTETFNCQQPIFGQNLGSTSCGQNNGSIFITVSDGDAPFNFMWENGSTGNQLSSVAAGAYQVEVTDGNNCLFYHTAYISDDNGPQISLNQVNHLNCYGDNNGAVFVQFSGGQTPISYIWSTGDTTTSINNVSGGVYNLTATDANGCKSIISAKVNEPKPLGVSLVSNPLSCPGSNDGFVTAHPVGGVAPYSFTWNTGLPDAPSHNGLTTGNYRVTVTDGNGCTANSSTVVTAPSQILILGNNVVDDSQYIGKITGLNIVGGQPPYHYQWVGPSNYVATTLDVTNLHFKGEYTLTITDLLECTNSRTFTVGGKVEVAEHDPMAIKVFPNPVGSHEQITVLGLQKGVTTYSLTDITGRKVYEATGETVNGVLQISISELPAGIYLLNLQHDLQEHTIKVIKS